MTRLGRRSSRGLTEKETPHGKNELLKESSETFSHGYRLSTLWPNVVSFHAQTLAVRSSRKLRMGSMSQQVIDFQLGVRQPIFGKAEPKKYFLAFWMSVVVLLSRSGGNGYGAMSSDAIGKRAAELALL